MKPQLSSYLAEMRVSRETVAALDEFFALVHKWNPTINLVSPVSLAETDTRHGLDSAQLMSLVPRAAGRWVDLGSGGGFPGLVVAILAREIAPSLQVTLVESDKRKATFLKLSAASLNLNVSVVSDRIEQCPPLQADILSARALASLDALCHYAERHLSPAGLALFLKGASYAEEISVARKNWAFDLDVVQSLTDDRSKILKLKEISRVR